MVTGRTGCVVLLVAIVDFDDVSPLQVGWTDLSSGARLQVEHVGIVVVELVGCKALAIPFLLRSGIL